MYLRTVFLQNAFTFALICCCSSSKKEWLEHDVLSKLSDECKPLLCSDVGEHLGRPKCECDEECSRYGTCCIDSPYAALTPWRSFRKREQCTKVPGSTFAGFMVSSCNPRWRGNRAIWRQCEGITQNDRDPLATIPVTNPISNMTYKNYFCSLCNFDHRGVVLWDVVLDVLLTRSIDSTPADRGKILDHLEYDAERNSWGIWQTNNDSSMEFVAVKVSAGMPSAVGSLVKSCDATVPGPWCASTWNDAAVRTMCQTYFSPIELYIGEGTSKFRNPHCAVCNYVTDVKGSSCQFPALSESPVLSFTLLLDVNPSDGDNVGVSNSCSKNEVYDPFFKKCRALVCVLPGYVVKDGQCTKT